MSEFLDIEFIISLHYESKQNNQKLIFDSLLAILK